MLALIFIIFLEFKAPADNSAGLIHSTAQTREWKNLLHYRKSLLGFTEKSEAGDDSFFLDPNGKTDPEAELRTDLNHFTHSDYKLGTLKQSPQCAFPERFLYLRTQGLLPAVKPERCTELENWKTSFHAQSVTLVYAAPYLGSPASMFGHTFLRIDSKARIADEGKNDLLDYGISFEAKTGGDSVIGYAIKGLIGSYPGWFSQSPFYLKVNTYITRENRDLWEYTIPLTSAELERLLNHIWELGAVHFDYYFFNRNCSYELLTLLEIAKPNWNLHEQFSIMAIPSDTVRAVVKVAGREMKKTYRPSLLQTLRERIALMSAGEKDQFFKYKDRPGAIQSSLTVQTLDALLDWNQIVTMRESLSYFDPTQNVNRNLLLLRAQAGPPITTPEIQIPSSPDEGHKSSKLGIGVGVERTKALLNFEFRPVFHDELDPDAGYLPLSTLSLLRLRASFFPSDTDGLARLRLDDFTFAEIKTLSPWTRLEKPLSWSLGSSLYHPLDLPCLDCEALRAYGSAGLGGFRFIYGLAKLQFDFSNSLSSTYLNNFRLLPSLEVGTILQLNRNLKIIIKDEPTVAFSAPGRDSSSWNTLTGEAGLSSTLGEMRLSIENWSGTVTFNRFLLAASTYF